LGVKNLKKMNLTLMGKITGKVSIGTDCPWVKIVKDKYFSNSSFLKEVNPRVGFDF